jgi:hypothetical protein
VLISHIKKLLDPPAPATKAYNLTRMKNINVSSMVNVKELPKQLLGQFGEMGKVADLFKVATSLSPSLSPYISPSPSLSLSPSLSPAIFTSLSPSPFPYFFSFFFSLSFYLFCIFSFAGKKGWVLH